MQADDVALHLADQHHPDDVHRLGRRDPQPAAELLVDAEPVELRGDLRAAAVHDDDAHAGVAQEDDVLGEGALQLRASVIALPPYFTTTVRPWKRSSQGSASTRTAPWPARRARSRADGARHVEYAEFSWTYVGGEVVGPDRRAGVRRRAGRR